MIRLLTSWAALGVCLSSFAQGSFQVKGTILDQQTKKPIEGATINDGSVYTFSSKEGEFTINNVSLGKHVFEISYLGYVSKNVTVEVNKSTKELIIVMVPSNTVLDEVHIFGKAESEEDRELPAITLKASKEFMNAHRENSLMQTLSNIPGVSTINIGSGQSKPVIRGLGFNRISVVQNGIKHEAQQWGSDHGLEIDQYDIEQIKIIKGPASLLYGSDAIAGVVDIQAPTIPTKQTVSGELNLLAETNNDLVGASLGVQGRYERWFHRGRLTLRDYADYKVPTDKINYDSYVFELENNKLRNTSGTEINVSYSLGFLGENIKSETFFSNVSAKNGFFANAHGLEVRASSIDYDSSNRDIDLPYHKVNHFKIVNNTTVYKGENSIDIELGYQNNYREEHSEPVPHGFMPKPSDSKERVFNKSTYSANGRKKF